MGQKLLRYGRGSPAPASICIEGNIGCGKTTLLNYLRNHYSKVFAEPVELWRNVDGENLFHYLYKDPARYSLAFQTYVQLTMIKLHQQHPKLMERSIYSARYCFVENLYKLNYLSRVEYVILDKWFKYLVAGSNNNDGNLTKPTEVKIDLIIYLRCCPTNIMERIKLRSRAEEKGISFDYVNNVHQLHEDWLINGKFPVPAPVLVIDTNCRQDMLETLYEKIAPYISGEKVITHSPTMISLNK